MRSGVWIRSRTIKSYFITSNFGGALLYRPFLRGLNRLCSACEKRARTILRLSAGQGKTSDDAKQLKAHFARSCDGGFVIVRAEEFRKRLQAMSDEQLIKYGKAAAYMANPRNAADKNAVHDVYKVQLEECRAE